MKIFVSLFLTLSLCFLPVFCFAEDAGLSDLLDAANDFVQSSPSFPAQGEAAPEIGAPENIVNVGDFDVDTLDPAAGLLPDAATYEGLIAPLADSVYYGSISTAVLDFASGIVAKHPTKDYVFFRSGQYSYDIYVGDITFSGSSFSGSDLLHIVYDSQTYNQTGPSISYSTGSLSLTPNSSLLYSNLGDYPSLGGSVPAYGKALIFAVGILFLFNVLRFVFPHRARS